MVFSTYKRDSFIKTEMTSYDIIVMVATPFDFNDFQDVQKAMMLEYTLYIIAII